MPDVPPATPEARPRRPARRVTLADVARAANVSPTLVSLVLRDRPGAGPATRERVLAAAADLGYRPDLRARSLASLDSQMLGVLFGQEGHFHLELLEALYGAAEQVRWGLALGFSTPTRDEATALTSLQDLRFDALVMLGPQVAEPRLAGQLPLVVLGWEVAHPEVDVVRSDDDAAMSLALEHLHDLGHRRIAHLRGGPGLVAASRAAALARAADRHDDVTLEVVECAGQDQMDGFLAMTEMLADADALPTAVVAYSDDVAAGALTALNQAGVRVPEQVSLVGHDDSRLAGAEVLGITTLRQDPRTLADLAVRRLVARAGGEDVGERVQLVAPTLVQRRTTGPAPA
ncbi:LacI family DNA-binding transcriptional regulator [Nocardioides bruguierae]|uniref:LacI family DNA-binding transcriptional regulator n=1 Tax=Nocardioides bruguierae TaxID=2945102 RepID=UPI0020203CE8|nr:LacI family DNA-binding transcriptional regulator [Nocardioides bruguierae]MCL8024516.1 LacI family transcriptional regulator [Nocardioides bruguierae]